MLQDNNSSNHQDGGGSRKTETDRVSRATSTDVGKSFEACKSYLLLVAQRTLDRDLKIKVSASDLVQQTFLEAHQDYARFNGTSPDQLRAWLRRILLNNVTNCKRHYLAAKRTITREEGDKHSPSIPTRDKSPSSIAAFNEETRLLERAIDQLSPEHRQVINLRNLQRLHFQDIGSIMNRSDDAARKLWFRAMQTLKANLKELRQVTHY